MLKSVLQRMASVTAEVNAGERPPPPPVPVSQGLDDLGPPLSEGLDPPLDCDFHLSECSHIPFYLQLYGLELLYIIKRVSLSAFSGERDLYLFVSG